MPIANVFLSFLWLYYCRCSTTGGSDDRSISIDWLLVLTAVLFNLAQPGLFVTGVKIPAAFLYLCSFTFSTIDGSVIEENLK